MEFETPFVNSDTHSLITAFCNTVDKLTTVTTSFRSDIGHDIVQFAFDIGHCATASPYADVVADKMPLTYYYGVRETGTWMTQDPKFAKSVSLSHSNNDWHMITFELDEHHSTLNMKRYTITVKPYVIV